MLSYLEELERICRSLMAMGYLEDEAIVVMAIKNKLPKNILELLKMEKYEKINWNVEKLIGLSEIVTLREKAQRCTRSLSYKNNSRTCQTSIIRRSFLGIRINRED